MTERAAQWLAQRRERFLGTPFGCLVGIFSGRMFRGSGEVGSGELDLGMGAAVVLLAMPGALASLLTFVEYGSLVRYLRGQQAFDIFRSTVPDEYFFIVLSLVVTGAAVLWRWDSIFLDRRDYINLVPLPISLRTIFLANLCAIVVLAGVLTIVVNGVSLFLFPLAAASSQPSVAVLFRFALGHAAAVFLASVFGFCAVFGLAGVLMALLPAAVFQKISLPVRFAAAAGLLVLLFTSLSATAKLPELSLAAARRAAILPPLSFLGIARTVWGQGGDVFDVLMSRGALAASAIAVVTAALAYGVSFRRAFIRIPEMADAGPLPRVTGLISPLAPAHRWLLRYSSQRACYQFVARTLLRSESHLQVVLGFAAVGTVISASAIQSEWALRSASNGGVPAVAILAAPFVMSYCVLLGVRAAFEMPADLRANWIFKVWLDPERGDGRAVARHTLLAFSLGWMAPVVFATTLALAGWRVALGHTVMWAACTVVLAELLVAQYRKLPFTCPYPNFQSNAPVRMLLFFGGYFFFAGSLPRLDRACLLAPVETLWLAALLALISVALYAYRKQLLDLDKRLIFEDEAASGF